MAGLNKNKYNLFKISISIIFGLFGYWLNFLDFQLFDSPSFKVSILLGLFFPLFIAQAWGWRYGLLSALAGGCQSMWWLWSGDGFGIFYSVPVFSAWIVWHGYWADKRRYNEDYKWYISDFAVEVPFRILSSIGFYTIFRMLVSFNPPPWNSAITWDNVPVSWVNTVVIKHILTAYILLLGVKVLLSLPLVRRIFGLEHRPAERESGVIYSGAILTGIFLWSTDSVVEYCFFNPGKNFWEIAALDVGAHDMFMRSLYIVVALFGGTIISSMARHRARLHARVKHINRVLTAIRNVNQLITHENDRSKLLNEACRLLIETSGFENAWITLVKDKSPDQFFHAGFKGEFAVMASGLREGHIPFCARKALEEGGLNVVDDPVLQCPDCPLADKYCGRAGFTMRLEHADRVYGWLSVSIPYHLAHDKEEQSLFLEVGKDIAYAIWALENMTSREETMREYSAVLNSSSNAIVTLTLDGRISLFNPGAEKLYECPAGKALGQPISHFCPEDLVADQENRMRRVFESGNPQKYETERLSETGRRFPVEIFLSPLVDEHKQTKGFSAIVQDISERKKWEKRLKRLNMDLQAKNAELEQVVYVASHDLRSPLVNIDGYSRELSYCVDDLKQELAKLPDDTDMLQAIKPILEQEIPESLRFIQTSASKMDKLLSGLLRLSRTGRAALEIETLDMNVLITKVLDSIEFQIKEAEVKIEISDLPPCRGDEIQVNQAFSNLVGNALKYLDKNRPGVISIHAEADEEWAVYCVQDNGIGINPEHLDNIFEIFHRLHPGVSEGDGLGLTIIRRIADRLGGSVWAESEPGKGSRFYFALPYPKK